MFSPGVQILYKIGICNRNCTYFDELIKVVSYLDYKQFEHISFLHFLSKKTHHKEKFRCPEDTQIHKRRLREEGIPYNTKEFSMS